MRRSQRDTLCSKGSQSRRPCAHRHRAPAPKNGVAKPGPRAETPQPTTARTRTLARKRAHLFDSNFDDAQTERGNSSGPDLRGDWGVETEAGAYERPLDGLQPRATLDYHENNRPATSIPRRP